MAIYDHVCTKCNFEWEETYSINDEPPKTCPSCKEESVKRLISLGGKGVVELYGDDLKNKVMAETAQLKRDMHKNENLYANMLGESKYQSLQSSYDKNKKR